MKGLLLHVSPVHVEQVQTIVRAAAELNIKVSRYADWFVAIYIASQLYIISIMYIYIMVHVCLQVGCGGAYSSWSPIFPDSSDGQQSLINKYV